MIKGSDGNSKVIVIGASLGGVDALQQLASQLPESFPAPIIVVLHIGQHPSRLPWLMSNKGPLKAVHASHGQSIVAGHIYVAPPDHHVLLDGSTLCLSKGPKEHHSRPALDPLFRSAALSRGHDVIGVVMTGLLDDGTAGLQAIKHCGGVAVVQDPEDAREPSMPLAALKDVNIDHCVRLTELGSLLSSLIGTRNIDQAPTNHELVAHEHALFLAEGNAMEHLGAIGEPSTFACPDCSGTLWEISNVQPSRYRCHTGHAFTLRTLEHALSETLDSSLWSAIRALQERSIILEKMAKSFSDQESNELRAQTKADAEVLATHADSLRQLVERVPASEEAGIFEVR